MGFANASKRDGSTGSFPGVCGALSVREGLGWRTSLAVVGVDWREVGEAVPEGFCCRRSSWTGPLDAVGERLLGGEVDCLSSIVCSCSVTDGSVAVLERTSISSLAVTETSSCSYKSAGQQTKGHTVKGVSTDETDGGLCIVEDDADMAEIQV